MSTLSFSSSSSCPRARAGLAPRPRSTIATTASSNLVFPSSVRVRARRRSVDRAVRTLALGAHSPDQRTTTTCSSSNNTDGAEATSTVSRRHSLLLATSAAIAATATTATTTPKAASAAAGPQPQQLAARLTPPLAPPAPLSAREQALVDAVARASRAVARVTDVSLPRANASAGPQNAIVGVPQGNGSGVVLDGPRRLLVTNYHVLAATLEKLPAQPGTDEARQPRVALVTFSEEGDPAKRATYDGFLVGYDRARDLCILRVGSGGGGGSGSSSSPPPLPALEVAPASSLRVGQAVVAIGSPFGFDGSVSAGVVSALNVAIPSLARQGATLTGCVAFDAAANPGSSGGALIDARGLLVGVPTAIFTPTGVSAGQGFAIPAEGVLRAANALASGAAKVTGAGLGVLIATDEVKARLGLAAVGGALIQQARPGGAADRAGLKGTRREAGGLVAGDIIAAVDGSAVAGATALAAALAKRSAGDLVRLSVVRGGGRGGGGGGAGKEEEVEAVLDEE